MDIFKLILDFSSSIGIYFWWLLPFIFVNHFVKAIAKAIKQEDNIKDILISSVCLMLIIASILYFCIY